MRNEISKEKCRWPVLVCLQNTFYGTQAKPRSRMRIRFWNRWAETQPEEQITINKEQILITSPLPSKSSNSPACFVQIELQWKANTGASLAFSAFPFRNRDCNHYTPLAFAHPFPSRKQQRSISIWDSSFVANALHILSVCPPSALDKNRSCSESSPKYIRSMTFI